MQRPQGPFLGRPFVDPQHRTDLRRRQLLQVAQHQYFPVPLGQAFSYVVPPELLAEVRRGARVLVEFGRRKELGVVLDLGTEAPDFPEEKLKSLRAIVDPEPVLQDELLSFLQELARYYIAPIGAVIELALPAVERTAAEALSAELGGTAARRRTPAGSCRAALPNSAVTRYVLRNRIYVDPTFSHETFRSPASI